MNSNDINAGSSAPNLLKLPDSFTVTFDGTAASGKTVAAKGTCRLFGGVFLSSGRIYRAAACEWRKQDFKDVDDPAQLAAFLEHWHPTLQALDGVYRVGVGGSLYDDKELDSAEVESLTPTLARQQSLRDKVTACARTVRNHQRVFADGRDAGTVIFQDAELKFFFDAPFDVRLGRHLGRGGDEEAFRRREALDAYLPITPVGDPAGRIAIDTSNLTIEETVAVVVARIQAELGSKGEV